MIRLYESTETDFTNNGIQVLDDIVYGDTCIIGNEINATYPLEMEVPIFDNDKWKDIDIEMLLKVPTSKGEQIFRIKEIVKSIDSIKVYGKHVFFDLENNFILDTNVVQKDGRSAINQILGAMANNMVNTYYGTSDISIVNNSRLVRKNVVSALIGSDDNSFVNRWGGELEVDNFNFSIKQRIGEDRDFQIRYRKNLTGFEGNTNTYNLCTRIVPIGFDGIMLEGTKYVDSKYIENYPQIYTYEIKFEDIKVKESEDDEEGFNTIEEARVALRQAAEEYFINYKCDLPTFSANVNFETLKYTEEYKDLNILERVELGDDVNVYIDKIDININARVVKTKYNFFTKKYTEIEIGDVKPNLFKQIANLKNAIDLVTEQLGGNSWQDILDKSLDEATKLMQEGLKDSHVISMKNQIVVGDAPDIKDMINCIVINKNGIGFSNNGYLPDRLISAMTIDGKINASCITTGKLNAVLIKTGLLSSANGTSWLNMEDGTFNFGNGKLSFDGLIMKLLGRLESTNNGRSVIVDNGMVYAFTDNVLNFSLGNNALELYDFYNSTVQTKVGEITSSRNNSTGTLGISLLSDQDKQIGIGYKTSPTSHNVFMRFNKSMNYGVQYPINVLENMYFWDSVSLGFGRNSGIGGTSHIRGYNGVMEINLPSNTADTGLWIKNSYTGQDFAVFQNGSNYKCYMRANTAINGNLHADGNITCNGSKTRVVDTDNYGKIRLNAYETPDCLFSDYGNGLIGEDGTCIVTIDDKFLETVNTNRKYRVLLTAIDEEDKFEDIRLKVVKKEYNYFIAKGNVGLEFDWNIIAKQKNYEDDRLIDHDREISMEEEDITKINLLSNETENNVIEVEKALTEKVITTEDELINEITLTENILMNGGI